MSGQIWDMDVATMRQWKMKVGGGEGCREKGKMKIGVGGGYHEKGKEEDRC